jgi:hypothetical protein
MSASLKTRYPAHKGWLFGFSFVLFGLLAFGAFHLARKKPATVPDADAAEVRVPPIDLDQPAHTETATFALG